MKLVRPLLIGLAVVALLLVAAAALAFTSGFQTWASRRALASQPGVTGTVNSVSAGLHRVEVRDARIEQNGAVLTLPALEAELPVVTAGLQKKVFITRLVAKGWVLDLSRATPPVVKKTARDFSPRLREFSLLNPAFAASGAPPAAAAQMFQGIFTQLQLPVELSLDGVELEGEVILPAMADRPGPRLKLTLRGGGLAAGREGAFVFELATAAPAGVAPVSAVALHGTLSAAMDTPHSFIRLAMKAEASASGTQFPRGVKLNTEISAIRDAREENYRVTLAGEGRQLAALRAGFPLVTGQSPDGAKLSGEWKIDLRDTDLAPFALGMTLPVFQASGEGSLDADAVPSEIHANGKLTATADKLAALAPELAAIGAVHVSATFDLAQHGDTIRVQQFNAEFSGDKPVAIVRVLQAFEFNAKTTDLKVVDPTQDLLGVTLQGVPLAWMKPFLKSIAVSGGDLQGELAASARDGGVTLRPKTPLTITQLSVKQGEKPLLRGVDISLAASADYTPLGWQVIIAPLTAKSGGTVILTLEAKAGQRAGKDQPVKATGNLSLNVPGALAQPALGGQTQLTGGDASVEFAASLGVKQEIQAKLTFANLAADPTLSSEKLPAITADLRADREAGGKITFGLPLVVERNGRKSDLNLAGTAVIEKSGLVLDAQLNSSLLVVDDVKILAVPFGAAPSAPVVPVAEKKNPVPDLAPPWAGLSGKIALSVKKIVYSGSFEAADVAGELRLDAGKATVDGLRAGLVPEGEIKLNGSIVFDAKLPDPYVLNAVFAAKDFNPAPLLRAFNPANPPTIEGKLNVNSEIAGSGKTVDQLAQRARGKFEINSKGGVFRGLAAAVPNDKLQAAQSTMMVVGDLLGGSTGKAIGQVSEIFSRLSEITYDQLNVKAERDESLNLKLNDFTLIAPEVRLGGAGRITYAPDKPLVQQALDMQFTLGARGHLGDVMGQLKLLRAEKDALGYTTFSTPIKVGGSLEKTDLGDLPVKIFDTVLQKSGITDKASELLNKLFGK